MCKTFHFTCLWMNSCDHSKRKPRALMRQEGVLFTSTDAPINTIDICKWGTARKSEKEIEAQASPYCNLIGWFSRASTVEISTHCWNRGGQKPRGNVPCTCNSCTTCLLILSAHSPFSLGEYMSYFVHITLCYVSDIYILLRSCCIISASSKYQVHISNLMWERFVTFEHIVLRVKNCIVKIFTYMDISAIVH